MTTLSQAFLRIRLWLEQKSPKSPPDNRNTRRNLCRHVLQTLESEYHRISSSSGGKSGITFIWACLQTSSLAWTKSSLSRIIESTYILERNADILK